VGTIINVANIPDISPPITVMANGWNIFEPTVVPMAIGTRAKIVVKAVIRTGRSRTDAAESSDSSTVLPEDIFLLE